MKLLSVNHDTKTKKGLKYGYLTGILFLAPDNVAQLGTVCPKSTPGCRESCLFTAGRGVFDRVQQARIARTVMMKQHRDTFITLLCDDICRLENRAAKLGLKACVRLNGTSDLPWLGRQFSEMFPGLMFYDYTKIPRPWERERENYKLTFSKSETNRKDCIEALNHNINVSVVFADKGDQPLWNNMFGGHLWMVDGDESDLRFLDQRPSIIALSAKGRARKDTTGFVVR